MAPTRRGSGQPPLTIDTGAAYEFVMSLVTMAEVPHRSVVEVGAAWLADVERRAGAELMARLADFCQGTGDQLVHLIPLVYETRRPRDVDAFVRHLEATEADDLVLHLVGYYEYHYRRQTPPETMRAAVAGDGAAVREFLRTTQDWTDWSTYLARHLGRDAADVKRDLLALLVDWRDRVWRDEEPRLMPILERDVEAKRILARQLPFDRFVEVATNGVQFVDHPGVERLVLVPCFVNRPWVSNAEFRGTQILVYPVADESVSADIGTPPLRLVRLAKALADEKRLRILRALAERPRTLMELADEFETPKTSMHHHMITLRSAGLVSVGAGTKDYRLRQDALPDLVQLLGGYLGTSADQPAPQATQAPASPAPRRGGRSRSRGRATRVGTPGG